MTYPGRQQSLRLNVTVTSGSGSGTFTNSWDIIRRIRVIPPSESVTYNCTIKDADGYIIFNNSTIGILTGTLSMLNEMSLGIIKTISIDTALQDGTFVVKLDMH